MFINKTNLKRLIEETVERILREQEEAPPPEPDAPAPEPAPEAAPADPAGGDAGDLDLDDPTGELEGGEGGDLEGTDLEGGAEGELGAEGEEGAEDFGGGGGGFTGGGGGFSFGDEGDAGLDADQPEEKDTLSTVGPEDVEIPADPVMAIVDDAIQLLNQTQNPQKILQNVKSSIQRYFPVIEDATPVIKNLWDTEDVVLRDVARRLLLFIKGV